jgi:hypothetical protein
MSFFGLMISNPNKVTYQLTNELQMLMLQAQKTQCNNANEFLKKFINDIPDSIPDEKNDPKKLKDRLFDKWSNNQDILRMAKFHGIPEQMLFNSMKKIINILIDNATYKGRVDFFRFKSNLKSTITSVCQDVKFYNNTTVSKSKSSFGISENNKKYLMVVLAILAIYFILRGNGLSAFGRKRR